MSTKTQFIELINSLDLIDNQVFKFQLTYRNENEYYPSIRECYGYFKYEDIDKLYDATSKEEFSNYLKIFVGQRQNEVDAQDYFVKKEYIDIKPSSNILFNVSYTNSNNEIKTIHCSRNINYDKEQYFELIPNEGEDERFRFTNDWSSTIVQTSPGEDFYYIKTSDGIKENSQILITTQPDQYIEGSLDDIKRKIYTGLINIETAPFSTLTSSEITLLKTLRNKGFTYLCSTPKGELYAFAAKSADDLYVNTIVHNGNGSTKGWSYPRSAIFEEVQGQNIGTSLGLRIAAQFAPLQSTSKFLYIEIPQDDAQLEMMSLGFIDVKFDKQ